VFRLSAAFVLRPSPGHEQGYAWQAVLLALLNGLERIVMRTLPLTVVVRFGSVSIRSARVLNSGFAMRGT